ncbi:MAG: hypothetical protein AB7O04_09035 [Hyphomonadaceae bacterium]
MKLSLALCAAGLLAGCASSHGPGGAGIPPDGRGASSQSAVLSGDALLWVSFDLDADYITTRAEAEFGVARELARAGRAPLTPIAFEDWSRRAIAAPDMSPFRLEFDRNVDGQITAEEFTAALMGRFQEHDANHDAQLTRAELVRRMPAGVMQRGEGGPPGGQRPPQRRPRG